MKWVDLCVRPPSHQGYDELLFCSVINETPINIIDNIY